MGLAVGIVKYLVFLVNLIFALFGFGIFIYALVNNIEHENVASWVVIFFGIITFIIAFLGCCGAIKEHRCMLLTFAVILIVFFVASLIFGGILVGIGSEYDTCNNNITGMFNNYRDGIAKEEWNQYQQNNECCGVIGFKDYNTSVLPSSCCEENKIECTKDDLDYPFGCSLKCSIEYLLYGLGLVIILVGLIEIIGSILAIYLAQSVQSQKRQRLFA